MTTSSNALWLLVVVGMLAVVAARLSRSLGPVGLILTIVLVIVLLKLARDLLQARFRTAGPDRQRATKNVTPQEGWLQPGDAPAPGPCRGAASVGHRCRTAGRHGAARGEARGAGPAPGQRPRHRGRVRGQAGPADRRLLSPAGQLDRSACLSSYLLRLPDEKLLSGRRTSLDMRQTLAGRAVCGSPRARARPRPAGIRSSRHARWGHSDGRDTRGCSPPNGCTGIRPTWASTWSLPPPRRLSTRAQGRAPASERRDHPSRRDRQTQLRCGADEPVVGLEARLAVRLERPASRHRTGTGHGSSSGESSVGPRRSSSMMIPVPRIRPRSSASRSANRSSASLIARGSSLMAALYAPSPARRARKPASSRTGTPSSCAFASFEPAFSPATT